MTRAELMPLKFKVQRQPIIPAGSWDKNPMVQHAEIWCCSLLLISFDWKGRKKKIKKKDQEGNSKLFGNSAAQLAFNTHGKETASKLNSKR